MWYCNMRLSTRPLFSLLSSAYRPCLRCNIRFLLSIRLLEGPLLADAQFDDLDAAVPLDSTFVLHYTDDCWPDDDDCCRGMMTEDWGGAITTVVVVVGAAVVVVVGDGREACSAVNVKILMGVCFLFTGLPFTRVVVSNSVVMAATGWGAPSSYRRCIQQKIRRIFISEST